VLPRRQGRGRQCMPSSHSFGRPRQSAIPTCPSWKSQPKHFGSADPPAGLSQHPQQRQGTSLRDKEDIRNRKVCRHEGYVGKVCQHEGINFICQTGCVGQGKSERI
jgi:hypothetical protein